MPNVSYTIGNNTIKEIKVVRDLGVLIDSSISFRAHIDHIVTQSSRLSGFINRQMKIFKQPHLTIKMYNTIVRGILEYCSVVWNPSYQVHSDRIERVQKRFLYSLAFSDNKCQTLKSYDDRLSYYSLEPLQVRRKVFDVFFAYKLLHGFVDSTNLLERLSFCIPRLSSRLHNRKTFALPLCKTNLGQHTPIYRMTSSCNAIRAEIDLFSGSKASFKNSLRLLLSGRD